MILNKAKDYQIIMHKTNKLQKKSIAVSDKFNHNKDGFKYFTDDKEGEIVKPLCIILPQMNGYIKYFEYGGKNMSFVIKYDEKSTEKIQTNLGFD